MPRLIWIALPLLLWSATVPAAVELGAAEMLLKEREAVDRSLVNNVDLRAEQQRRLAELRPRDVTPLMVEEARLGREEARIGLENAKVDLEGLLRQREKGAEALKALEDQLQRLKLAVRPTDSAQVTELEAKIAELRATSAAQGEIEQIRQLAIDTAQHRLGLADEWLAALEALHRVALAQTKQEALDDLKLRLEREQQGWTERATNWRRELQQLEPEGSERQRALLQARILDAEERARLAAQAVRLAQVDAYLDDLEQHGADEQREPPAVKAALDQVTAMRSELQSSHTLLDRRLEVLQQQRAVVAKRRAARDPVATLEEQRLYEQLDAVLVGHQANIDRLLERIAPYPQRLQVAFEQSFRRGLTARRPLPDDSAGWARLTDDLLGLPKVIVAALLSGTQDLLLPLTAQTPDRWVLLVLLEAALLGAIRRTRRYLSQKSPRPAESYLGRMVATTFQVIQRSHFALAGLGSLLVLIAFAPPSTPSAKLLVTLALLWFGSSLVIHLSWSLLIAPGPSQEPRSSRLYTQLRHLLRAVALLGFVAVAAHALSLSSDLVNLLDRLFMLSLLLFVLPALETRRLGLSALHARFGDRYWVQVIGLLALLAPLSVLTAASVGVAGYINLARAIGAALAVVVAVLALWLVLSRLVGDGTNALKNLANLRSNNGLLWTKGVIEPLHALLRSVLFIVVWSIPLYVYGVGFDNPVLIKLLRALEHPLFSIGGTSISAGRILIALAALVAVIRTGRWLRLITYRWAFSSLSDEGIRNSLSVFSQYTFVLVGLLLTLHLAGIDLTTMAIFAGALGVGIGFGLQNIANNFISGILLLAERPLRTSDIVRVGEHEGEVTHIGMRSITVRTWDNQEVIMPNSDVISAAFTNWTHNDNIMRTVVKIRVDYDTDPHQASELIQEVLSAHPELLPDPEPQVWLQEFADSAMLFHVQYFTDLKRSSRLGVRSEILMNIWSTLRSAGIVIPRPQLEIRNADFRLPQESSQAPVLQRVT